MVVLGLRFCARAFSSCGKWGPLFIVVRGPLIIAAFLVAEHRLKTRRLSNCGSRAQLLRSMWDLPRPGLEPVSPALAGRLSTTALPGKPRGTDCCLNEISIPVAYSIAGCKHYRSSVNFAILFMLWFYVHIHVHYKAVISLFNQFYGYAYKFEWGWGG